MGEEVISFQFLCKALSSSSCGSAAVAGIRRARTMFRGGLTGIHHDIGG
jgi:hypothetical protein